MFKSALIMDSINQRAQSSLNLLPKHPSPVGSHTRRPTRPRLPAACGDTAKVCCLSRPPAARRRCRPALPPYKVIPGCIHPSSCLGMAMASTLCLASGPASSSSSSNLEHNRRFGLTTMMVVAWHTHKHHTLELDPPER